MNEPVSLDLFGVLWRLGATLFFVLLNGFFVAAEFAFVKVRTVRIEHYLDLGPSEARGMTFRPAGAGLVLQSARGVEESQLWHSAITLDDSEVLEFLSCL